MDSFTQRMMNRATSRKAEFEQHMNEILAEEDGIDDPNLGSLLEAKRREYREFLKGMGTPQREMTDHQVDDKENCGKPAASISHVTKDRLKKLGGVYGGEESSGYPSPVGYGRRQAEKELMECESKSAPPGKYSEQRSKRLANLASAINNWEDESDKKLPVTPRSEIALAKAVMKPVSSPAMRKKMENFDKTSENKSGTFTKTKKVAWDDRVLQSLEMQGFQRCDSDQHLVFDYKSPQKSPAKCSKESGSYKTEDKMRPSMKKYPAPAPPTPVYLSSPSRSSSPQKSRSASPVKYQAPSPPIQDNPYRSRSVSPVKYQENPTRYRADSPVKYRAESPVKYRAESPVKYRAESPVKYRAESPVKYRAESPVRYRAESPVKYRAESPVKYRAESPVKYRAESPVRYRAESPSENRSESPASYCSESPVEYQEECPVRYRSESPVKYRSESPLKHRSESPERSRSVSPVKLRSESPTKTAQIAMSLMHETLPVKKIETNSTKPKIVGVQLHSLKQSSSGSAVLEMAAKYENEKSPAKKVKDPTELSIHDRMAIFEKNHGGAILPKAPFGMPVPAKVLASESKRPKSPDRGLITKKVEWKKEVDPNAKDSVTLAILERQNEIEMLRNRWERKREENTMQGGPTAEMPPEYRKTPLKSTKGPAPPPPPMPPQSASPKIRMGTRSPLRHERSASHSPVRSPYASPKVNRRDIHNPLQPRKSSELVGALAQIKKIKVSPPKAGRIYPSISDIETESEALETESDVHESDFDLPPREARCGYDSDSEESAFSLGQAVIHRARSSQVNLKRAITTSSIRSSRSTSPNTTAQESRILHEMDDFLDEALGDVSPPKRTREGVTPYQNEPNSLQPSGLSGSCQSDSFEYQPKDENKEKKTPLVHTVSTYRKMEAQKLTPKLDLHQMEMEVDRALTLETPESALVQERIFELEQEMIKQTTIISQATQALNLCHVRPEFAGSMEQVEAEKLLLIATSRRLAAQHEIERLKVEKTIKPGGMKSNCDKGSLTIEYISLPIKMCPTEHDKTEHFLCLVTSGVSVQATQVLALKKHNLTRGNRLAFTKPITLENLYCDFTVTIEVYKLSCKNPAAGVGPASDVKEEKKRSTMLRLTPQKKNTSKRNNRIPIESPGGPNSVRSPSFKMVGYVVFSLREVKRNKFTLNKVPYGVPLDGTIELSMSSALKSEVEYRGFLTQFEEVSGFGAWKRKWALLKGSTITFWLYPEHEEQSKIPIDTVDLGTVKTKEIGLVSREICARPHTIMLETDCGERKLLSADTLDDRLAWTTAINKSLQLLRAWGGRAY